MQTRYFYILAEETSAQIRHFVDNDGKVLFKHVEIYLFIYRRLNRLCKSYKFDIDLKTLWQTCYERIPELAKEGSPLKIRELVQFVGSLFYPPDFQTFVQNNCRLASVNLFAQKVNMSVPKGNFNDPEFCEKMKQVLKPVFLTTVEGHRMYQLKEKFDVVMTNESAMQLKGLGYRGMRATEAERNKRKVDGLIQYAENRNKTLFFRVEVDFVYESDGFYNHMFDCARFIVHMKFTLCET